MPRFVAVALLASLAACGPTQSPPVTAAGAAGGALTDADRAAIRAELRLTADEQGLVMNECGEPSRAQFLPAELGGSVGTAILFALEGGPNTATCYGDGPDLHLFLRAGAGWREIYSARGRMLIILPTATGGVRDLGDGGPGFSFPVWQWNGAEYSPAGREISDAEVADPHTSVLP